MECISFSFASFGYTGDLPTFLQYKMPKREAKRFFFRLIIYSHFISLVTDYSNSSNNT